MGRLVLVFIAAFALASPALAQDSITGNGPSMSSINSGTVTSNGVFNHTPISGGAGNTVTSSATGALVNVQILKQGVDGPSDTIGVSSINAQNKSSGTITANGVFNGSNLSSSNSGGNGMGVSAAGTSVNISIIHR